MSPSNNTQEQPPVSHHHQSRQTGVIVFTHGSKVPEANAIMIGLVARLRCQLGTDLIEPCFMELVEPDIPTALRRLIQRGCQHIFACALFLVPGRHLSQDIPQIIESELQHHAGVTYELSEPLMADALFGDFVAGRIAVGIASSNNHINGMLKIEYPIRQSAIDNPDQIN